MTPDDGQERLLAAVEALAVSSAPIQRRLEHAGVALAPLQARDFTDPANGARLEEIRAALTRVSDPGPQGAIVVSTAAMDEEEAVRVAQLIVELHRSVYPW